MILPNFSSHLTEGEHLQREAQWQEQQVIKRRWLNSLLYDSPAFDGVRDSMLAHLKSASTGGWILDIGCGEGRDLISLNREGISVIGVDLSWAQLRWAKERMDAEPFIKRVTLIQADATALPFRSGTFHFVFGKAILHHISHRESALKEIERVLHQKGYLSFAEPMAYHPLFWLGRHLTPHLRSADERPFRLDDFYRIAALFEKCEIEFWFLLAPLAYILRLLPCGEQMFQKLHACLSRLDRWLFQRIPTLRAWAWYGVIRGRKCEGLW